MTFQLDGRRRAATPAHPEYLFAYGTLQLESVQLATFGRRLTGTIDVLQGFELTPLLIEDREVVALGGMEHHTMARATGRSSDVISGRMFAPTRDELQRADGYEVESVRRVSVVLNSGLRAWVYVDARCTPPDS